MRAVVVEVAFYQRPLSAIFFAHLELITKIITPSHSKKSAYKIQFFLLAWLVIVPLIHKKRKKINFFSVTHRERQNNSVFAFVAYVRKVKFHEKQSHWRKAPKEEPKKKFSKSSSERAKKKENCWLLLKKKTEQGPKAEKRPRVVPKTGEKSLTARIFRVESLFI